MEYTAYVRKPMQVDAVQVTEENIEEVAELIGELLSKTEEDGSTTPFIQVDKRMIGNNAHRVWPGYWITKVGKSIYVFNGPTFNQQFVEKTPDIDLWSFLTQDGIVPATADSSS